MNGEPNATASGIDLGAIGSGVLWGLGILILGAITQAVMGMSTPLSPAMESVMPQIWQGVGALLGGYLAGRRAAGNGLLHGAVSGIALILSVAAIMGVHTALPALAAVLKMAGIGAGAGALGGIFGVNLNGR